MRRAEEDGVEWDDTTTHVDGCEGDGRGGEARAMDKDVEVGKVGQMLSERAGEMLEGRVDLGPSEPI